MIDLANMLEYDMTAIIMAQKEIDIQQFGGSESKKKEEKETRIREYTYTIYAINKIDIKTMYSTRVAYFLAKKSKYVNCRCVAAKQKRVEWSEMKIYDDDGRT